MKLLSMLVFLSLLSTALAAPQLYHPYGTYGYPGYYNGYYPTAGLLHHQLAPRVLPAYPHVVGQQVVQGVPATRTVVKLGNFLEINGMFEEGTTLATGVTSTIKGNFNIQQNGLLDLFSGNEAKITAYIMSSNDLTGKNIKLHIGTGTDCMTALAATGTDAPVEIAMVNVPPSINGFYVNARTTGFNIDGMNGKTSLMGATKWLLVTESGVGIGCSMASLQ